MIENSELSSVLLLREAVCKRRPPPTDNQTESLYFSIRPFSGSPAIAGDAVDRARQINKDNKIALNRSDEKFFCSLNINIISCTLAC